MKKILVFLVALTIAAGLYAVDFNPSSNDVFSRVYSAPGIIDVRALGMGGAGLADTDNTQSIWSNPARLGNKKIQFSLPSVGLTFYNPLEVVKTEPANEEFTNDEIVDIILNSLTTGHGKLLDVDSQLSFSAGGLGLGLNVKNSIYTYAPPTSTGGLDSKFYDAMAIDAVVGYGYKFNKDGAFSLSVGASVGASALMYTDLIGVSALTTLINDGAEEFGEEILNSVPVAFGAALPIKVGVAVDMPLGLSFSAVGKLNGSYNMKIAPNIEAVEDENAEFETFKLDVPFTVDAGAAWSLNFLGNFLRPVVAVDVVDVVGLVQSKDFSKENLVNHVKAGAEIRGLWIFDVRAGINNGYWTAGAAVDLGIVRLDAAYYWQEMGDTLGQKGVDAITIKCNVGW